MSESGNGGDDAAVRPADRGKLTQELEEDVACEEGMSAGTPAHINKEIAQLVHPEEVSDVCRGQQWSNVQSDCLLGTGIKVGTVNGSLDGRAKADDATEESVEPPDEPNENVVDEVVYGRKRRFCLDGVDARTENEGDENISKDEFETRRKKEKPTKLEDLKEESCNSKDTNLNMSSENSKRRKLPVTDDEYNWHDFIMTSSDQDAAEKPKRRKEAKVSNAKKPTTASSGKAKIVELASTDESMDNPIYKEAADQICIDDSDELTIADDASVRRSRNNRPKRRDSVEMMSSVYPRRIVPPLSGGKHLPMVCAGRRSMKKKKKTKLEDFTEESCNSKDTNLKMTLKHRLERGKSRVRDDEYDWRHFLLVSSDEEGAEKPPKRKKAKVSNAKKPMTAGSSKAESVELVSTDESKDNLAEIKLIHPDEQRVSDEEDTRGKLERVKQRVQEEAEKAKLEERNEKLRIEKNWRDKIRAHERQRQTERIESNSQGPRQGRDVPSVEVVPESLPGMKKRNVGLLEDNRHRNLYQRQEIPCPICGKNFPAEEIEVHADSCEKYDEANFAGCSGSNSPVLPTSWGTPNQRDMFSCMPRKAGHQDRGFEQPARTKKAKMANTKKPTTASSSKTKRVDLSSTDVSRDNLAETKSIYQEERRIRDEAATRRKVERVKRRLQEEAKRVKLEQRNEKLRFAFEQNWGKKARARQKVPSVEVVPENHSGMKQRDVEVFSDDWRGNLSPPCRVLCPICSNHFSVAEIEAHAAHCELYDAGSSAERNRSNSPVVSASLETPKQRDTLSTLLTCDTCSNFTTRNGRELEDHVASCLARWRDDVEDGSGSVTMVSNSPVVPVSLGTPKQRDMLSSMTGQAGLLDDEVAEEFENGEEEILQSSLGDSSRIVSSTPSRRSSTQRERLQPEQQREDEATLVDLQEQRVRDDEETRRNAEAVKQRVQAEAEKAKLKELEEKRRFTMIQKCREKTKAREKQRQTERIESSLERPRQGSDVPSTEVVPESHSGLNERDFEERSDDRNLPQTEQFPCPICGINFPAGEIETHAALCVESASASSAGCSTSYSPVIPISSRPRKSSAGCSTSNSRVVPISSRPPKQRGRFSTLLECYMCSKFTTKNGWEFEAHVTSCLARQRESRESICGDTG